MNPSTISAEILEQIILFSLPAQQSDVQYYDTNEIPWTTSQVCRRWSSICRSSPSLWFNINYWFPVRPDEPGQNRRSDPSHHHLAVLLARRLKYAGHRRLHIRWDCSRLGPPASNLRLFTDILLAEHRNMKTLDLCRVRDEEGTELCSGPFGRADPPIEFPSLQSLSLGFGRPSVSPHMASRLLACFQRTPALTELTMPLLPIRFTATPSDRFSWGSLTTVSLGLRPESIENILSILDLLHSVKSLRLGWERAVYSGSERYVAPSIVPRLLPHLIHLEIAWRMGNMLRIFDTPQLRALVLTNLLITAEDVYAFLHRTKCVLLELQIQGPSKPFYRNFPFSFFRVHEKLIHLTHLDLRDLQHDHLIGFIHLLTPSTNHTLLPKLKQLFLIEDVDVHQWKSQETMEPMTMSLLINLFHQLLDTCEPRSELQDVGDVTQVPAILDIVRVRITARELSRDQVLGCSELHSMIQQAKRLVQKGLDLDVCWLEQSDGADSDAYSPSQSQNAMYSRLNAARTDQVVACSRSFLFGKPVSFPEGRHPPDWW